MKAVEKWCNMDHHIGVLDVELMVMVLWILFNHDIVWLRNKGLSVGHRDGLLWWLECWVDICGLEMQ